MAATNTGAKFKYNLAGRTSGILYTQMIKGSEVITIGDFVKLSTGYVTRAAAGNNLLGVVVGIVDKYGIPLDESKWSNVEGTWSSSTYTLTVGSHNPDSTSYDQYKAIVDIDPFSVWSIEPDSTIGGTTGSNLAGYYIDLIDEDETDENTAHASTQASLHLWGVDPEDATRHLVNIYEHQAIGGTRAG